MKVEIIDCPTGFANLREHWNRLTDEPMLRWEWMHAWWQQFGGDNRLMLLVIHDAQQIRGIAPLMVERRFGDTVLRFLGSGDTCTDYMRVICQAADQDTCDRAVVDFLIDQPAELAHISVIEFEGVDKNGSVPVICDQLTSSYWQYDRALESSWAVELGDSWEEFLASRNSGLRRKIRKAIKLLDQSSTVIQSTRDGLDLDTAFQTLVDLHQQRFISKGEPGVFADADFTKFLLTATRQLAADGRAEIVVCSVDDKPLVAHLYLVGPMGRQMYQSGIDSSRMKLEPGHLLFAHTIRQSLAMGHHRFDFLRGDEPYKAYWGAEPVQLLKIRCVTDELPATIKHRMVQNLRSAKHWWKNDSLNTLLHIVRAKNG